MFNTIAVTNRKLCKGDFIEQIEKICKSGEYKSLMLREKDLSENEYELLAEKVYQICRENNIIFIVNKFYSVTEKIGADYIQLSFNDYVNYKEKNEGFKLIGVSVHSLQEALYAEKSGAAYVIAGHIYQTACKKDISPRGVDFLSEICYNINIPVYAIGGIKKDKFNEIKKAGAKGVCIMSGCMK